MVDIAKHFRKGYCLDHDYGLGPKVYNKSYSKCETISITFSEFIKPNLFFGFEISDNPSKFDTELNYIYWYMNRHFRFKMVPHVGTIVVANYKDDKKWYRAKVLKRDKFNQEVDVYFIDYGNIERHVPLSRIRKLESVYSSQYQSFDEPGQIMGRTVLFGFVGVKPLKNVTPKDKKKAEELLFKEPFEFQVIELPVLSNENRNKFNIRIPFYLIKRNPFCKNISRNYEHWLIENLGWQTCSNEESFDFIRQQIQTLKFDFLNIQLIMPRVLKDLQKDGIKNVPNNKLPEVRHDKDEPILPILNGFHTPGDDDENLSHDSFVNSMNGDGNSTDTEIKKNECIDVTKNNSSQNQRNDDDLLDINISKWKVSTKSIRSRIPGLHLDFPLPDLEIFPTLISTLMSEKDMVFHVNICGSGIGLTLENLEKALQKHYGLCYDSMLKHYMAAFQVQENMICLCANDSTFYRCIIKKVFADRNKAMVHLFDIGDTVEMSIKDLWPINERFEQVPQFAIACRLAGIPQTTQSKLQIVQVFNETITKKNFMGMIGVNIGEGETVYNNETRGFYGNMCMFDQPLAVDLYIDDGNDYKVFNEMLCKYDYDIDIKRNLNSIPEDPSDEMTDSSSDDVTSNSGENLSIEQDQVYDNSTAELNDYYLRENIYQKSQLANTKSGRPVCEYFRQKGRCNAGKKCPNRHVTHSDASDSEEEVSKESEVLEKQKLFKSLFSEDSFNRELTIGKVFGIRVTSIYNHGLFYAYLTHGISGFNVDVDEDENEYDDLESDLYSKLSLDIPKDGNVSEIGQNFVSIYEMEDSIAQFLIYQPNPISKSVDLTLGSIVAIRKSDKVHRAIVKKHISDFIYEVFLLDYGFTVTTDKRSLYYLPGKFYRSFQQQCFMFKLDKIHFGDNTISGRGDEICIPEKDTDIFVDWLFEKVNNKVLHAKIISSWEEGSIYNVEVYDYLKDGIAAGSLNQQIEKMAYLPQSTDTA